MKRSPAILRPKEFNFTYKIIAFAPDVHILSIWKEATIYMYRVREFSADPEFHGRAFRLDKIADTEEPEHYNVLVGDHPIYHRCSCIGFLQFGYCKHVIVMDNVVIDEKENNDEAKDKNKTDTRI